MSGFKHVSGLPAAFWSRCDDSGAHALILTARSALDWGQHVLEVRPAAVPTSARRWEIIALPGAEGLLSSGRGFKYLREAMRAAEEEVRAAGLDRARIEDFMSGRGSRAPLIVAVYSERPDGRLDRVWDRDTGGPFPS